MLRSVSLSLVVAWSAFAEDANWKRHVIAETFRSNTAVAGDFTGDGVVDVIANEAVLKQDVLFIGPGWKREVIHKGAAPIHSAALDVDGDGDLDYVAAEYSPGLLYSVARPGNAVKVLTKELNGIHGLTVGDINGDKKPDIVANSAQPKGAYPESMAWLRAPDWSVQIAGKGDAPGLSHYMGIGDVDKDGIADIASGAKVGNWFYWWKQGKNGWTRQTIAENQEGASNIFMTDVNGDGRTDFLASRGHGKGVLWFEGPSWKPHDIDTVHQYPHSLGIGDIDGDGDIDAAACSAVYNKQPTNPRLAWFENDGKGKFKTHVLNENQASYDLRLVDMDRDGDLDILVAGQESRNVIWYENRLRR